VRLDTQTDPRVKSPRVFDLRKGRPPDVEILTCSTYDFLLSMHVCLASAEYDYADFDIGRAWIESARARCAERDPEALGILGRYFGDGSSGSLCATLISLVWKCPEPRDTHSFLAWLRQLPAAQLAEVLLDHEAIGSDWVELLALALTGDKKVLIRLVARYPEDLRPTVTNVLRDLEGARKELLGALEVWYEAVFSGERERIQPLLQHEAELLERKRAEMPLEPFLEDVMHGVRWQRPAGLRRFVFAPSYFCGPAVFYHFWHGTLTFCPPIVHATPDVPRDDPRAPDEETLRFFLALGDPSRLRILRLLAEREMYLTELAERLELTKATTKHHMVKLRDAGLVTLYVRERLTYYSLRPDVTRHAAQLLGRYLSQPVERPQPAGNGVR
jgi:DNA-binding transcriptional ArsR family regulator